MRTIAPKVVLTLALAVSTIVWGQYAGAQSDDEIKKRPSEHAQQLLESFKNSIDDEIIDMDKNLPDNASGGCPPTDPCCAEYGDNNCEELTIS